MSFFPTSADNDNIERPKQRISTEKKTADNKKGEAWRKDNIRYFSNLTSRHSTYRQYMENLYRVASGYLDEESYNYVVNPTNTDKKKYTAKAQARLNNYDIITPIIMLLLGDKIDRVIKPTVTAINSDIENIKKDERTKLVNAQLDNIFANAVQKERDLGIPEQEEMSGAEIDKIIENVRDEQSIQGAKALEYIEGTLDIPRKFRKSFYHWIVTYVCGSIKNVNHKDIEYDSISPLNLSYNTSEDQDFIEDGESASATFYMTTSEIIDRFYDELDEKDLTTLESRLSSDSGHKALRYDDTDVFTNRMLETGKMDSLGGGSYASGITNNTVTYVNWKSLVKIGVLEITDAFGEVTELEVDEDFIAQEGEELKWSWVNQTWEGWNINDDIYFGAQPVPFQRGKFDNPSACKLLINGRTFMNAHFRHKSPLERLLPHQKRYNVVSWHLEKLINKNKDKIVLMPYGVIPDNEDMDMFDMMYYADEDSYMFVDTADDKAKFNDLQHIKVLDLSLSQNMAFLSDLLKSIKLEAEEGIGINRQRKGDVNSSDGKGTNEDAVQRSSIMTSEIFEEFEEFEEREWQGMLDLSKVAWVGGKKEQYINGNKRRALLDIDEGYSELEMGVKATRSSREIKKLEKSRANAQAFAQNGALQSTLIAMEQADSLAEIEDLLIEAEDKMAQQAQAGAKAEQDAAAAIAAEEARQHDENLKFDYYKVDTESADK